MIKRTLLLVFTFIFILTTVAAFAAPAVDYIFYAEEDGKYYIFGRYDEVSEDVGIYYKGDKFSYVKNGDTTKLDKANESGNLRFGIAFKAPKDYFSNLLLKPYSVKDGVETVGKQRVLDKETNSMKDDNVFFEDFSNDTAGETDVTADEITFIRYKNAETGITSDAFVSLEENKEGILKNMIKLTDGGTGSSSVMKLKIPEYKGNLTFEMRFKFTQPAASSTLYSNGAGFILDFNGGGKRALRLSRLPGNSSGITVMNSSGNITMTNGADVNDKWLTLKVYLDATRKVSSIRLENEEFGEYIYNRSDLQYVSYYLWQDYKGSAMNLYNETFYNEYKGGNIDEMSFSTYNATAGEYLIDYINVYTEGEDFRPTKTRAESKSAPVIADPVK